MKTVLMFAERSHQKALASKIQSITKINSIILYSGELDKKPKISSIPRMIWRILSSVLTGLQFRKSWLGMLNYFEENYLDFPEVPIIKCSDINNEEVINEIKKLKPDLVVVSGTNLLRDKLINEIHKSGKVINLHTGISPYIRGGPNCSTWCLALKEFWLIGNTIMWLDKGIDSGNLIATERTPLSGTESLLQIQIAVINHAHDLYIRCIKAFLEKKQLPNVPQSNFSTNRLFLTKDWSLFQMLLALFNFYFYFYPKSKFFKAPEDLTLIDFKEKTQS